jgi:hypothetical protein
MTKKKSGPSKGLKLAQPTQKKNGTMKTAKKSQSKDKPLYTLAKELSALLPAPLNLAARAATEGINAIRGFGDYEVMGNSLGIKGTAGAGVPAFSVPNSHRVVHRECLGTVTSPGTGFTLLKKLVVNPSDPRTFPWLSSIAKNYISYIVHGMVFIFESNSSEYAATSGLGSVCLATRYDPREDDYQSFVEMQNSQFAISSKPSQNIIHPIECAPRFQPTDTFYVRRGNESETTYMYDKCKTYLGVEGLSAAAGTVIGRIWVTYDIEFKSPALEPPIGGFQCGELGWGSGSGKKLVEACTFATYDPNRSTTNKLIAAVSAYSTDPNKKNAPLTLVNTDNSMRFYKKGIYWISWNITGSGLNTGPGGEGLLTTNTVGNCGGTIEQIFPTVSNSSAFAAYTYLVVITVDGNSVDDYFQVRFAELATGTVTGRNAYLSACPYYG